MEIIAVSRFVSKEFQTSEAIKTLRTNLIFTGSNIKAVSLTSFSASEGKSTLSFQLAASIAQAGKRVLLVDADLRKSVLATRLHLRNKAEGLSHFLSGQANANELIYETDVPKLYIMFAGTRVPNASELLGSENFPKLIEALKEVFDYVIVDAAPIGQVIDCAVMAPALDGVLLVIDATHNSYKLERRVKQQLEMAGAKILGVVLNRVDFKDKGGYYGKAYGYGYGEPKTKKKP
ncbi:MAG: CpsD/CapB family tyrosine-protein kinase [Oscillospiraceae bacterium]|nr:CpsD/CapB family tyrosine-protein kinase [Oscillospiraceae bacterium]